MLTTCGTVVRRVGHQEVNRATGAYIAKVVDVDNALGGVWHVFTRSKHGWLPWKKGWDQSIKVITCPVYIESRIPATVSNYVYLNLPPLRCRHGGLGESAHDE